MLANLLPEKVLALEGIESSIIHFAHKLPVAKLETVPNPKIAHLISAPLSLNGPIDGKVLSVMCANFGDRNEVWEV